MNFRVETDFNFGPLFGTFMQKNPDFGELVRSRRYQEAEALLGPLGRRAAGGVRVPSRPGLYPAGARPAGRSMAVQEAQAYDGPEPYEILHGIGTFALDRAS